MELRRRQFLQFAGAAVAAPAASRIATAQTYPTRPITIMVGAPAGGPTDTIARILAQHMRVSLRQAIIIENNGTAGGTIAHGRTARAAPDGYTLSLGHTATHVLNGAVYSLTYDVSKDFEPISLVSSNSWLIAAKSTLPPRDLQEFIGWLKANPGTALQGLGGIGAPDHVASVLLQSTMGIRWQFVPYRGSAPLMQDLVAGQIDWAIPVPDTSIPQMRAGRIKIYAVAAPSSTASSAGYSDRGRGGITGILCFVLAWALGPEGNAEGNYRHNQCGTVDALADEESVSALRKSGRKSSRGSSRIRGRLPPCRWQRLRNGGRSS